MCIYLHLTLKRDLIYFLSAIPNYNRMEKGEREIPVKVLEKLADLYKMKIDEIIHFEEGKKAPKEVQIEDKELVEQVKTNTGTGT